MDPFPSSVVLPSLSSGEPQTVYLSEFSFHKGPRDSKYKGDDIALHLKRNSKQNCACTSLTIKVDILNLHPAEVHVSENQKIGANGIYSGGMIWFCRRTDLIVLDYLFRQVVGPY